MRKAYQTTIESELMVEGEENVRIEASAQNDSANNSRVVATKRYEAILNQVMGKHSGKRIVELKYNLSTRLYL